MGGFLFLILSLGLVFVFSAPSQTAATQAVQLNEFVANPQEGSEWVELYNASETEFDLDGWQVDDQPGGSLPLSLEGVIQRGGFLIVEIGTRLNNGGDEIRLLSADGEVKDSFKYESARKGFSFARLGDHDWLETESPTPGRSNWQASASPTSLARLSLSPSPSPPPSPPASTGFSSSQCPDPNVSPSPDPSFSPPPTAQISPTPSSNLKIGQVILNEFVANPIIGQEWVELSNQEEVSVSLNGWQIDDLPEAGSPPHQLSGEIEPLGFVVFEIGTRLNNSGDAIRLIRQDKLELERFDFDAVEEGYVWAKDEEGGWQLSLLATPGEPNLIISPPTPTPHPLLTPDLSLTPRSSLIKSSPPKATISTWFSPSPKLIRSSPASSSTGRLRSTTPILVKPPSFDPPWCPEPEVLAAATAEPEVDLVSGPSGEKKKRLLIISGGLFILIGLVLLGRKDMVRCSRALLASLASRLDLVLVDLPPFEHPEDIARNKAND